jgi:hypothetical protein
MHKPFVYNQGYVFCDICAFSGYQNEKVVYQFEGLRPETEDGFIYKYGWFCDSCKNTFVDDKLADEVAANCGD